jgi:MFS family permease
LALPLTAILLVNAGPSEMGILAAAQTLPVVLFGLPAGAWVDRLSRRRVMMTADLGRFILLASIPLAVRFDELHTAQLYVVAFGVGTLSVLGGLAAVAFLPTLVGREHLVAANSRLASSEALARVVGPSVGGMLVQLLTAPFALIADAGSYVISAATLALLGGFEAPDRVQLDGSGSLLRDIREGLQFVRNQPVVRALALTAASANLSSGLGTAVYVLFATRDLGLEPVQLGLVYGIGSLGAFAAMLAGLLTRRFGVGRTMIAATFGFTLATLVVPMAPGPGLVAFSVLAGARLLFGLHGPVFNVTLVSLRQVLTPNRLQGRVNATARVIAMSGSPVGALLGGALGGVLGLRATLVIAGCTALLALVGVWHSPVRKFDSPLQFAE